MEEVEACASSSMRVGSAIPAVADVVVDWNFALANLASADAIITAWDNKRYWNFWRPITAIREGDNDGNPLTAGDPTWLPLIGTPPYPDYTSGANNLTGAMTRTLELYFGNRMTFSVISNMLNQTKTYHHFSDMADDVVNVRIYQGIHFRSADEVARRARLTGPSATFYVHSIKVRGVISSKRDFCTTKNFTCGG